MIRGMALRYVDLVFVGASVCWGFSLAAAQSDYRGVFPPAVKTIGIVMPASVYDKSLFDREVGKLREAGYCVKLAPRLKFEERASPASRAADLVDVWTDSEVDLVLCARGGHGVEEIVPYIDWVRMRTRPGVFFLGFSDITILHNAFLKQNVGHLISGPTLSSFSRLTSEAREWLSRAIDGFDQPPIKLHALRAGAFSGLSCGGHAHRFSVALRKGFSVNPRGRVVWLYRRTHEKKYLDFATYIVKGMTEPKKGPRLLDLALKGVSVADRNEGDYDKNAEWEYVCKYGRSKAYEMMSCYQGILDYAEEMEKVEVEGRDQQWMSDLRRSALRTAEDIVRDEINLAGGCACSEAWFHGARKQHMPYLRLQETCVTTTWMRFCEKLLKVTDDPKWADQIEWTFYNAYLSAMKADGSEFAGYTPLSGNRYHGQHHCYMHTDCCTANGSRGFLCFLKELYRKNGDTATFNFYASALVDGFDMYSLYPRADYARIVSHTKGPLKLRLRIPAWSAKTEVKLNGEDLDGIKSGSYFTLDCNWEFGDIVEVKFDMPIVAHTLEHNVAFTRGPVLLARDSRFNDGDLTEPFRQGIKEGQAMPTFTAVRSPSDDIWMTFSATLLIGSHSENPEGMNPSTVLFCDFASAGNTWRRDNYYRTWFPIERGPAE